MKVKVNVHASSNCVICIQKAILPYIFICRWSDFCNNSLKFTSKYKQNYCPLIGTGFSYFNLTQRHIRWPQRCAPCSAQSTQIRKWLIIFNKTAALLKMLQPIHLYTYSSTNIDIQTNQEQGQGHYKVKIPISLINSRNSTICLYLDSKISTKPGLSHKGSTDNVFN